MTLARGLQVLKALSGGADEGRGVKELCAELNVPRVSLHRLLATLLKLGWVERDEAHRYHLGIEAWRVGVSASRTFDLVNIAGPSLDAIEAELQDTTFLLRRTGAEATCIARREGTYLLKFLVMDVGVSYPMGVGAGSLAILAYIDPQDFEETLKVTARKLKSYPRVSVDLIRRMAAETRRRGYALTTGFIVPSASALAVPLFDADNTPIGSIACVAAPDRFSGKRLDEVVSVLRRESETITMKLSSPATKGGSAQRVVSARRQRTN